jgi:hypothetical protein
LAGRAGKERQVRQFVADIIESVETEPERWRAVYCTWRRDDGVEVWRANMPILDIGLYQPAEVSFTLFEKVSVWLTFRKWQKQTSLAFLIGSYNG